MFDIVLDWLSYPSMGSVIGIVGVLIAIVTFYVSRSVFRISSYEESTNLIGGSDASLPKQVNILYEGKEVPKLSTSSFIIWNSGNKVIHKDSLKTIDPLRINAKENINILEYKIEKLNNPTNNITLTKNNKMGNESILIEFDFLEKNNGLSLEVLHTGTSEDVFMSGKVIGVSTPMKKQKNNHIPPILYIISTGVNLILKNGFLLAMALFFIILLILSFIFPEIFTAHRIEPRSPKDALWLIRAMILLYILTFSFIYYKFRLPYPSSLKTKTTKITIES